ncbi:hypothetical protein FA95DRAFT_1606834 [Auriscalpium vulgare]|uniref:Uncharacterized protein n=1 Tax=Auriscalpium vulgare TaxID=40419 RepID=A0ACB8RRN5_9AGAM|nr:hypothetical protein FA95DRAFT_1606834 [Auriscalpium vulgare]
MSSPSISANAFDRNGLSHSREEKEVKELDFICNALANTDSKKGDVIAATRKPGSTDSDYILARNWSPTSKEHKLADEFFRTVQRALSADEILRFLHSQVSNAVVRKELRAKIKADKKGTMSGNTKLAFQVLSPEAPKPKLGSLQLKHVLRYALDQLGNSSELWRQRDPEWVYDGKTCENPTNTPGEGSRTGKRQTAKLVSSSFREAITRVQSPPPHLSELSLDPPDNPWKREHLYFTLALHVELALMFYVDKNFKSPLGSGRKRIGCSKRSCAVCYSTMSCCNARARLDSETEAWWEWHTSGTHGKWYATWKLPDAKDCNIDALQMFHRAVDDRILNAVETYYANPKPSSLQEDEYASSTPSNSSALTRLFNSIQDRFVKKTA